MLLLLVRFRVFSYCCFTSCLEPLLLLLPLLPLLPLLLLLLLCYVLLLMLCT